MKPKFYAVTVAALLLLVCFNLKAFSQLNQTTVTQIQQLIAEKQSRTPAQQKISSQLLQAERESRGVPMAAGVTLRPANVNADIHGGVAVDINATVTDALLASIKSLGGQIIFASPQFHSIRAKVNLGMLETIAGYSGVNFIRPASMARSLGAGGSLPVNGKNANVSLATKQEALKQKIANIKKQLEPYLMVLGTGSVESQGDHTMGADSARLKYGYAGQGVRIGVLNESYNALKGAAADVKSGDLPGVGNPLGNTTPVTVVQDDTTAGGGQTDEGRAMLQIVHDLAPKAQLFFATSSFGPANFASNILKLRAAPYNCDILIDDVEYADEPPFQDGTIAQAVNTVTANGAMYFSSAGNQGSRVNLNAGVWEYDFNDSASAYYGISGKLGTLNNFASKTAPSFSDPIINPPSVITLFWADPLGKSNNDYDLFVTNPAGNIEYSSTDVQNGSEDPFEGFQYTTPASGDRIVVFKTSTAQKVAISVHADLDDGNASIEYLTNAETHGHASAANAFCVAATPVAAAYPGIFTTSDKVENFSSDGPRRIFFNADSTPVTPGNFLFATNGGLVRLKPDITAADGVSTTFTLNGGLNPFFGTSAAAPHAGAVAALLKSAKPSLTAAQMRTILTTTALDIQATGWDINSGYGIVQAYKAMQSLNPCAIATTKATTLTGCSSVVYKSKTYTASTVVHDTVRTAKGCDSIYNVVTITIAKITPVIKTATLTGCNSVVFLGKTYTASTTVKDTIRSVQGCDSIYNTETITITKITPVTKTTTYTGCNSVVYSGKTYTASTTIRDTVRSAGGCDSVYNVVAITIKITPVTKTATYAACKSVVYLGKTYTASTTLRDTLRTAQGCDSIYNVITITVNPKPNLGKDTTVYICAGSTRNITNLYNTTSYATVIWKTANPDSVGAGSDTLVVITATYCRDTAVVTVTANPLPAKPVISSTGTNKFCLGDSLLLTATTTGTLQWLRDAGAIKQATAAKYEARLAGSYTVKATSTAGCSSISAPFAVSVVQVATPTITLVNDTLVSSAATGNQWFEDFAALHGDTSRKFSPVNLDIYTVQVTQNGCKSFMSDAYIYMAGTSSIKTTGNLRISLSPNPAANTARLEISGAKGIVRVMVTDMAGKRLWQSPGTGNGLLTLPVQSLASGTYIVTVMDGNMARSLKLVIAR